MRCSCLESIAKPVRFRPSLLQGDVGRVVRHPAVTRKIVGSRPTRHPTVCRLVRKVTRLGRERSLVQIQPHRPQGVGELGRPHLPWKQEIGGSNPPTLTSPISLAAGRCPLKAETGVQVPYRVPCGLEKWLSHLAHNQEVTWFESRIRYQVSRCNRFCTPPCQGGGNGFKSRRDRQDVCRSGLTATLGKRVGRNAPWVRIPQHPPGIVAEW